MLPAVAVAITVAGTYFKFPAETKNLWLREPDLNRQPSGYEPDELPTAPSRVENGGGRRIRTFESVANRFTVCPL